MPTNDDRTEKGGFWSEFQNFCKKDICKSTMNLPHMPTGAQHLLCTS